MTIHFHEQGWEISSVTGGQLIRTARELRGYSQSELSESYGIAIRTLRNYEQGLTEPGYLTVAGILDFLGLRFEDCWEHAA